MAGGSRSLVAICLVAIFVGFGIVNPGGMLGEMHEQVAFLAVAIVGLIAIGMRVPYLVALAGALFLFGGYRSIEISLERRPHAQLFRRLHRERRARSAAARARHHAARHPAQGRALAIADDLLCARIRRGPAMLAAPTLFGPARADRRRRARDRHARLLCAAGPAVALLRDRSRGGRIRRAIRASSLSSGNACPSPRSRSAMRGSASPRPRRRASTCSRSTPSRRTPCRCT